MKKYLLAFIAASCLHCADSYADKIHSSGVIQYVEEVDGGIWGIFADDGSRFNTNGSLPSQFQENDLVVEFEGSSEKKNDSKWGEIITIEKVTPYTAVFDPKNSNDLEAWNQNVEGWNQREAEDKATR